MTELAKPVHRIQQNVLAVVERRLLDWFCERLPARITPDLLTAIVVLGSIAVAAGYALSPWGVAWLWLAIAGFCINWFGDSLDGSLARFRKIERPQFGYFIDHSLDAIGNLFMAMGLGLSGFVRLDVALFAVSGYLLLSIPSSPHACSANFGFPIWRADQPSCG
jgi:archaetidylinositol phosphate synthase